jgi:hypothetical protein
MSFFTKVNFPHWTSHCLTNPHTVFKACGRCEIFLQLELAICHQGHMFYCVIGSSVSPLSPENLGMARNCVLLLNCLSFSV